MIIRYVEICPVCGQWNPWVVYKTIKDTIDGEKSRQYVKCRRCGAHDVVSWRLKSANLPNDGNVSCRP